jgi:protocatechuate 3,4-dioxygenase beta subunit
MLISLTLALLMAQAPTESKLASLEGTVTHAGSQAAIRKAKVSLTAIGFEGGGSAESGDDGKYWFKELKPGRYRLSAEKSGYETTAYGAKKPGDALGQIVRVDAGVSLTGMSIALPKHGVIAGKVLDSDNEPVQKALVMALGNFYNNGKLIRIPRGAVPVMTDDQGAFRIGQLPPGKYIVCAVPMAWLQPTPGEKESKPTTEDFSTTTCYPNVAQMSEATQLEIQDATEVPGIDMRLLRTKTVSVQGRLTGLPTTSGSSVTILNLNTKNSGPIGTALNPRAFIIGGEGKFEFKNVIPGSYILHTLPTGLSSTPFIVKMNVDIGDQPVTDLQVPALTPFEIKAKIQAEPGPNWKMGALRLVLTPVDEINSALAMGTANADGDLTLTSLVPGRYRLQMVGAAGTHYVNEIRIGDQVVEGDEVEISSPKDTLTVSFALAKAEVNGTVVNAKGEPVPGATVGLIPTPRRPFRQKYTSSDQNGALKIPSIAPGEYYVVAFDRVESGALESDEFLKPFLSKMKKVKLDAGGGASVELSVLQASDSKR